jgi:predicted nucleotide-binding protein
VNTDEVQRRLEEAGLALDKRSRLGNDTGDQLRFKTGEIVNVFDKGTFSIQGKNQSRVRELLEVEDTGSGGASVVREAPGSTSRKVFVVYGHDQHARDQLEAMLRRWHLEPLILDQLPSEGQTIIEKLEKYTGDDVRFAVVLATPDDEGYVRGKPDERKYRARQNVVLELGLLLAKLGRSRVAILLKHQDQMERPSDVQGLIYLPFTDSVDETKVLLAKEMDKQGIRVEVAKL